MIAPEQPAPDASTVPTSGRDRARTVAAILTAVCGFLVVAWLVREEGVAELGRRLARLGPVLPLVFVPYTFASLADALGWRAVLAAFGVRVPFARLWLVRVAGEAVNSLAPTGVGGEPLKVMLLRADGAPGSAVGAAVVASRTALTVAQALLVVLGVGALLFRLGWTVTALAAIAGLLAVTAAFAFALVRAQQRGAAGSVARIVAWIIPSARLADRIRRTATRLDASLATVYGDARRSIAVAAAWHMLAWLASAGEVWAVLRLLDAPVSWRDALIIEGLAQPIRATGVLVPGALGTQEGGGVALCRSLGIAPGLALAMWLVRRARETVFDAIGLAYLAARGSAWFARPGGGAGTNPRATAGAQTTSIRPSFTAGR